MAIGRLMHAESSASYLKRYPYHSALMIKACRSGRVLVGRADISANLTQTQCRAISITQDVGSASLSVELDNLLYFYLYLVRRL